MAKMKPGLKNSSRNKDQLREINVEIDFTDNALASVLYKQGNTVVLACATCARNLPRWFPRDATRGWVNAEYSLLPGSTDSRFNRERRGAKGRTMEIERLVARSLRGAIDLEQLGPLSITVDCDILNADGGTRCASVTAANIALRLAVRRLIKEGRCLPPSRRDEENVILNESEIQEHELSVMGNDVAAVSVGLIGEDVYLDLDYDLDSNADVDLNVVMISDGRYVEIQGTGEEATFSHEQLNSMLELANKGMAEINTIQQEVLKDVS